MDHPDQSQNKNWHILFCCLSKKEIFENFSDFRELKRIKFELFGGTLSLSIIVEVSLEEWASPTSGRWPVSSQQGTLTEREGSVQLTSLLRQLVLFKS